MISWRRIVETKSGWIGRRSASASALRRPWIHELLADELDNHADRESEELTADLERQADRLLGVIEPGDGEEVLGPVGLDGRRDVGDGAGDTDDGAIGGGERLVTHETELVVERELELVPLARGDDALERRLELIERRPRQPVGR